MSVGHDVMVAPVRVMPMLFRHPPLHPDHPVEAGTRAPAFRSIRRGIDGRAQIVERMDQTYNPPPAPTYGRHTFPSRRKYLPGEGDRSRGHDVALGSLVLRRFPPVAGGHVEGQVVGPDVAEHEVPESRGFATSWVSWSLVKRSDPPRTPIPPAPTRSLACEGMAVPARRMKSNPPTIVRDMRSGDLPGGAGAPVKPARNWVVGEYTKGGWLESITRGLP